MFAYRISNGFEFVPSIRSIAVHYRAAGTAIVLGLALGRLAADEVVENFRLLDHQGLSHELYYYSDYESIVITAYRAECDVDLAAEGVGTNVKFFYLDSNETRSREEVARGVANSEIPVLLDPTGIIGGSLRFSRVGDTVVLDPLNWTVVSRTELANARSGEVPIDRKRTSTESRPQLLTQECAVGAPSDGSDGLTYANAVAPVLIERCVQCHRQGGMAPWSMDNHTTIRGFAPMIREVLRTQRMPPWHADPHHGEYSNSRALSHTEVRTIVRWIEDGADIRGDVDPLANYKPDWPDWTLGRPDIVIDIPPFRVPASGVVEYQYPRVDIPIGQNVWVRAVEIRPGDPKALHHVLTSVSIKDAGGDRFGDLGGLGGYAPGDAVFQMPENTGVLLRSGSELVFQMHYAPYGKNVVDRSKVGIYTHKTPPLHELRTTALVNTRIRIPARVRSHHESASHTFQRDVVLYSLLPHAHYRATASEFRVVYPHGGEEILLSVPYYDFNWQTNYVLATPKLLPRGSKVIHTTWWDNSERNRGNPDPNRVVSWGWRSTDEMLLGWMTFRYQSHDEGHSR